MNDAPTDIALSSAAVDENQPSGTTVGTLSTTDPDAGDTHTYSLVSGTGSTDNASFQISGSTLQTAGPLDFEAGGTRSVRIRTDDGHAGTFDKVFTITLTDGTEAPPAIVLSTSTVAENPPPGTTVGTLSTTDPDSGDTHTYTLVSGTGSTDNGSFTINGTAVQTNTLLDYETKNSYSIRVQTDDGHGHTFQKALTISVTDVNDAPSDIGLSNSTIVSDKPSGTTVGTLSSTDQDVPANSFTYSLVSGTGSTDNASFQISGDTLQTNTSVATGTYHIRIQTSDGHDGTIGKQFTDTASPNNRPTDIS